MTDDGREKQRLPLGINRNINGYRMTTVIDKHVSISLLRGICQMPAYVAYERGYWSELGIDVAMTVEATAWLIPNRLLAARGESR